MFVCLKNRLLLFAISIILVTPSGSLPKGLYSTLIKGAINPQSLLNCTTEKTVQLVEKRFFDNFYTVEKGRFYRSAQLSPDRLEHYIKKHSIKTIINLRGKHPELDWWQDEAKLALRYNINFHNIAMSANELTPQNKLLELMSIYNTTQTPILVHCRQGRDRTGEASALWVYEKMNSNTQEALEQLSFFPYQHVQALHPAKSFLINIWQGQTWLEQEYNSANYPQFQNH